MKNILFGIVAVVLLNSCATIIGGTKYYAHVSVDSKHQSEIYMNGNFIGRNSATATIKRKDANRLKFEVKSSDLPKHEYIFSTRKFRGWAFIGSIFSFNYYYIPIGLLVDISNGSLWKPDDRNHSITKIDYKNYRYILEYNPVEPVKKPEVVEKVIVQKSEFKTQEEKLRDLKKMYDEGIIDQQEYKILKSRVLEIEEPDTLKTNINPDKSDSTETITRVIIKKEENLEELESEQKPAVKDIKPKTEEDRLNDSVNEKKESQKLSPEKQEKLDDLNRMLELGIITEQEHKEMKEKLIYNE